MEEGSNWRAVVVEVGTTQKADEVQNAIVVICHAAAAGRDEAVEEWRYVDIHWYMLSLIVLRESFTYVMKDFWLLL